MNSFVSFSFYLPPSSCLLFFAKTRSMDSNTHTEHLLSSNRHPKKCMEEGMSVERRKGLSSQEAAARLEEFGYNELPEKKRNVCFEFLAYFWGPMPLMIWVAMLLEFAQAITGDSEHWADFVVLLILQVANGTVAFFEERNAGNAIAALKASLAPKATVKRDGRFMNIPARELVPGDVVNLKLGNIVPADCVLLEGKPMQVDRSALTGESLAATVR